MKVQRALKLEFMDSEERELTIGASRLLSSSVITS